MRTPHHSHNRYPPKQKRPPLGWPFYILFIINLDYPKLLQFAEEEHDDRHQEHSAEACDSVAEIDTQQADEWVKPYVHTDDFRLYHIAYHKHDTVCGYHADSVENIAGHKADYRPWNKHRAHAQNRQGVDDGNTHCKKKGVRHFLYAEADEKLTESDADDYRLSLYPFEDGRNEEMSYFKKHLKHLWRKLFFDKTHDCAALARHKICGNKNKNCGDKHCRQGNSHLENRADDGTCRKIREMDRGYKVVEAGNADAYFFKRKSGKQLVKPLGKFGECCR